MCVSPRQLCFLLRKLAYFGTFPVSEDSFREICVLSGLALGLHEGSLRGGYQGKLSQGSHRVLSENVWDGMVGVVGSGGRVRGQGQTCKELPSKPSPDCSEVLPSSSVAWHVAESAAAPSLHSPCACPASLDRGGRP